MVTLETFKHVFMGSVILIGMAKQKKNAYCVFKVQGKNINRNRAHGLAATLYVNYGRFVFVLCFISDTFYANTL